MCPCLEGEIIYFWYYINRYVFFFWVPTYVSLNKASLSLGYNTIFKTKFCTFLLNMSSVRPSHVVLQYSYLPRIKLMHIENSMKKPRELAGPPSYTLHWSMLIIVILNGALGFFGYIRYGERCLGSIPLNLPSDNRLT